MTTGKTREATLSLKVFLPLLVLLVGGCSPFYVIEAGWKESRILLRRKKIDALLASKEIDRDTREKFELVVGARTFSENIGLEPGGSYTQYSKIDGDVLVWVLSVSPKTSFTSVTWWFPIVGRVPYKGFFDKEDGVAEAKEWKEKGYDVYLRPSPAFSTLGWFNDPLLSTVLAFDDISLVNTVIHEILHNTVWIPNHVSFNESLANSVGMIGAYEYFQSKMPDSPLSVDAKNRMHDEILYAEFISETRKILTELYTKSTAKTAETAETKDELLKAREVIFKERLKTWQASSDKLLTSRYQNIASRLNNAVLISQFIYLDRIPLFLELYDLTGNSLKEFIVEIKSLGEVVNRNKSDPFARLAERLQEIKKNRKPNVTIEE